MSGVEVQALEPALSKFDRRVLAVVPAYTSDGEKLSTVWMIGEALECVDLSSPAGLLTELNGLEHLGYITSQVSSRRKRRVYWRTPKGDEALTA